MVVLLVFHSWYLPRVEKAATGRSAAEVLATYGRAFVSFLAQPQALLVLAFVLTYKLGDEVLFSMNSVFLMRALKVPKEDLSWMVGIAGTACSIAGSLVSAWAIKRFGWNRAVWPLTLAMNLNIWAYVWLAWAGPVASEPGGLALIATVNAYEQLAAGLGNAVLVVYIMRRCHPDFKAAHYAIASAIASVGGSVFGGLGGVIVEAWGYVWLYGLAFLAAIPSMGLLFLIPRPED
jgi:PAT family beta-lactamase induction signal transducer AmpG